MTYWCRPAQLSLAFVLVVFASAPADLSGVKQETKEAPSNYTETIPGTTVTFEMIAIPGGSFTMGSQEAEPGRRTMKDPRMP
ncbi:MAG: hypothetical protein DMG08_17750 [Acidobacteria bacterium]|nr:MAG: hypothetical protein DMG08_17750 [Acidobacteriota bacterium]